jgi:hypothetical protein
MAAFRANFILFERSELLAIDAGGNLPGQAAIRYLMTLAMQHGVLCVERVTAGCLWGRRKLGRARS